MWTEKNMHFFLLQSYNLGIETQLAHVEGDRDQNCSLFIIINIFHMRIMTLNYFQVTDWGNKTAEGGNVWDADRGSKITRVMVINRLLSSCCCIHGLFHSVWNKWILPLSHYSLLCGDVFISMGLESGFSFFRSSQALILIDKGFILWLIFWALMHLFFSWDLGF